MKCQQQGLDRAYLDVLSRRVEPPGNQTIMEVGLLVNMDLGKTLIGWKRYGVAVWPERFCRAQRHVSERRALPISTWKQGK